MVLAQDMQNAFLKVRASRGVGQVGEDHSYRFWSVIFGNNVRKVYFMQYYRVQ